MPVSMRSQTIQHKKRVARRKTEQRKREAAAHALRQGLTIREAAQRSNISITTTYRIHKALSESDNAALRKLLHPTQYHAGKRPVLEHAEEKLVIEKINEASQRGFAVDVEAVTTTFSRIAADGRQAYAKGYPSADAIRSFRARNRSITLRKAENLTAARLAAENYDHVRTLKDVLILLSKKHPNILKDPRTIWNWDETAILPEFGKKVKCFTSSTSKNGGRRYAIKEHGKHVTAGIAANAAGDVAPLVLVVSGSRKMSSWLDPLDEEHFRGRNNHPHRLTKTNWCPDDASILMSKNGSIDRKILPNVIDPLNTHIRKILPSSLPVVLIVDGHSSRESITWLERCAKYNIEAVKLPANTTHFLQPCDRAINKRFQECVRSTRDELMKMCHIWFSNVNLKIKLGVAGHQAINRDVARKGFVEAGLWPMNFQFMIPFKNRTHSNVPSHALSINNVPEFDTFSLGQFEEEKIQVANRKLVARIHDITGGNRRPSYVLSQIALLMKSKYIVNNILDGYQGPIMPPRKRVHEKNFVLGVGNKAELMAVEAMKKKLKEKREKHAKKSKRSMQSKKVAKCVLAAEKENRNPEQNAAVQELSMSRNINEIDDMPIAQWIDGSKRAKGQDEKAKGKARAPLARMALCELGNRG